MGAIAFQLPAAISADARADLERACIAGGQDGMPFPTQVNLDNGQLTVHRGIDESGQLVVPWDVPGLGRLMLSSATLMERKQPYDIALELARGKIHQLRNQTAEWVGGGLILSDLLTQQIKEAAQSFGKAASRSGNPEASVHARQALVGGHQAAQRLVQLYIDQVFQVRHLRQAQLDTHWGVGLPSVPTVAGHDDLMTAAFNTVTLPISWSDIEPREDDFHWEELDRRVAWAAERFTVLGGPLIDFSGRGLPDWLWSHGPDVHSLSEYLNSFVDQIVRRYSSKIRHWQVSAASNWPGVLANTDEELIWLAVRLSETVRKVDPNLGVSMGLSQPWGDYLAQQEHNVSPFGFVDTLLRTGLRLDALDLELIMGVTPRGSYCRDPLEVSRLLDLYVLLGVPLHIQLAFPSASQPDDAHADRDLKVRGGHWGSSISPKDQAEWARVFGKLVLCKPYAQSVSWAHWSDAAPHQFPHAGLVDAQGNVKPALEPLKQLRAEHLK